MTDHHVVVGEDAREKWRRGAQARIIEMGGVDVVRLVDEDAKKHDEAIDLDPSEFRGLSLIDLAREALGLDRVRTVGMLPMEIFGRALIQRGASGWLGEFQSLLENTVHRVALAAYRTVPNTWPRFCAPGCVPNFLAQTRPRFEDVRLEPLNDRGEFSRRTPAGDSEGSESIKAEPRNDHEWIGISRVALMNNDVGPSLRFASGRGMLAGSWIESAVYELLASNDGLGPRMSDGRTLFHQFHRNITLDAPLSDDAIAQDRRAMASGDYRYLRPSVLVLSEGQPQVSTVIEKQFDYVVHTARVNGTRRYLFASPNTAPTIEVAFLEGQQQPSIELAQAPSPDGLMWKIHLVYGVAARNWCSAITNAGCARS